MAELATGNGQNSIKSYVKTQANLRNQVLYASDNGIPSVTLGDGALVERAKRVCVLLCISIIILQTDQKQLFAIQCLEGFLKAINAQKDALYDYPDLSGDGDERLIMIDNSGPGRAKVTVRRPVDVRGIWNGSFGEWSSPPPSYSINMSYQPWSV